MAKPNKPCRDAIIEVLETAGNAMHYTEIADEIIKRQLRKDVGATPASTVNVVIHESIRNDKEASPFLKVGRGEFVLKGQDVASDGSVRCRQCDRRGKGGNGRHN